MSSSVTPGILSARGKGRWLERTEEELLGESRDLPALAFFPATPKLESHLRATSRSIPTQKRGPRSPPAPSAKRPELPHPAAQPRPQLWVPLPFLQPLRASPAAPGPPPAPAPPPVRIGAPGPRPGSFEVQTRPPPTPPAPNSPASGGSGLRSRRGRPLGSRSRPRRPARREPPLERGAPRPLAAPASRRAGSQVGGARGPRRGASGDGGGWGGRGEGGGGDSFVRGGSPGPTRSPPRR